MCANILEALEQRAEINTVNMRMGTKRVLYSTLICVCVWSEFMNLPHSGMGPKSGKCNVIVPFDKITNIQVYTGK